MNQETITLHESDITTLKQIAVFVAQEIAKKATRTDEIHQCTVALETELHRINQLPFAPTEIVNPHNLLNREDRYLLKKAKELQAQGKLRTGEISLSDVQS